MILNNFKGLNLNLNTFNDQVSQGYFEVADNVVINKEGVIEKRKGFYSFLKTPPSSSLALCNYDDKLILLAAASVSVVNFTGSYEYSSLTTLTGQTVSITNAQFANAGGNLYFISDTALLKLENSSSNILKAGVCKAPDCTYLPLGTETVISPTTGIHLPDSQIGYRVLFGRTDANHNLVLGAPSEFAVAQNSLLTAMSVSLSTYDVVIVYNSHPLVTNDFVTIRESNGSVAVPDGEYVVTAYTANNFTISTIATLSTPPSGVTALKFGIRLKPKIEFTVPTDVDAVDYIYRIYRSDNSISNLVEPDMSTLQLIQEANLTSTNLSNGYIQFEDSIDEMFKSTYLYTNPNTGEGELEANFPPPVGTDVAVFKEHLLTSEFTTFNSLNLNLIRATTATFGAGDYINVIQVDRQMHVTSAAWTSGTSVRYGITSLANIANGSIVCITGCTNAANNGLFTVTSQGTGYLIATNAGRTDATLDESSLTVAYAYPVRRYTAAVANSYNTTAGGDFLITTSSASVATNIDSTARAIAKVINRDTLSTFYCSYVSTSQSLPGQLYLYSKNPSNKIALQANDSDTSANFDPPLPYTNVLTLVSQNDTISNGIAISKIGEFEAFPLTSYLQVGSRSDKILRIMPLKNSVVILKGDGVFRLSGSSRNDFSIYPIDNTVKCLSPLAAIELNGVVYAQTDEGVARITETDVSIISSEIDELLKAVYSNPDFLTYTSFQAIPDQKLLVVSTVSPSNAKISYYYNYVTNTWTSTDRFFSSGCVFDGDSKFYGINDTNYIVKMRKNNDKFDYCDDSDLAVSVTSVAANKLSATATSSLPLMVGDILVFDGVINRITSISNNVLYFSRVVNFIVSDTLSHYKSITSTLITSPISGDDSTLKRFTEFNAQFRNRACKSLEIGFTSDSNDTDYGLWSSRAQTIGWGVSPWGLTPWGGVETTVLNLSTSYSQPLRIYVPVNTQISTWLKVKLKHTQAAEEILLQSIGLKIAVLSDRISS